MKCPKCQGDTYVTETRTVGEGTLRRRRTCCGCLNKFVTLEAPEIEWKRFKVELAAQAKAGHMEVTQAAKAIVSRATKAQPEKSKAEREKSIAEAAAKVKRQKVREMDKLPDIDDGYDDSLRDFINVRGDGDEWN